MRRRTLTALTLATAASLVAGLPALTGSDPAATAASAPAATGGQQYLVGTGIADITGAVAETGAFGYAANQEMDGLHDRLYSRAFVVADKASGKRVAYVSVDLATAFQSVKLAVSRKLAEKYGDTYGDANVMIAGTHTHAGTSGLSHNMLYMVAGNDKAGYGYDQKNFDGVVDGIVASITKAHDHLEPGTLDLATGTLTGATKNRSVPAYKANKDAGSYDTDVNTLMTQLSVTSAGGKDLGLLNWFAIHPTSYGMKNTHISGDNKAWAQYHLEKSKGSHPNDAKPFVAAFAQSDTGDVVSTQGNSSGVPGYKGDPNDDVNVAVDGRRQLEKSQELSKGSREAVSGAVDYRFRWVDLGSYTVDAKHTGGTPQKLCKPARGYSFASGGENGPSNIPGIYEGMTKDTFSLTDAIKKVDQSFLGTLVRGGFSVISVPFQDPCQVEKPVLLPSGAWGWAPTVLPLQILRVGDLAIVGLPGEATTMAGRRIRAAVQEQLGGSGVKHVVIAGMANDYTGYVTTREEYATQNYEGASTEFGPHQLGAFLQEYEKLGKAMADGSTVSNDTMPKDVQPGPAANRPGVVLDDKPAGQEFGQVLQQPKKSYAAGDTATAVFRGAHPKNDLRHGGTFLKVQRQVDGQWQDYLDDHDWDTSYTWKREGASFSRTTVDWRIGKDTPKGTYRLVQLGDWKNGWNGTIAQYEGSSEPFTVG